MAAIAILCAVSGGTGNLCSLVALTWSNRLNGNKTTWFVLSLHISDIITSIMYLPICAATYLLPTMMHGEILCFTFPILIHGNTAVALLTILAITINRYIRVCFAACYEALYTAAKVNASILLIWIIGYGSMIIPSLGFYGNIGRMNDNSAACTIISDSRGHDPNLIFLIASVLCPFVAIIVCYTHMYVFVKKARPASFRSQVSDNSTASKTPREVHLTKTMSRIFLSYCMCYGPTTHSCHRF